MVHALELLIKLKTATEEHAEKYKTGTMKNNPEIQRYNMHEGVKETT